MASLACVILTGCARLPTAPEQASRTEARESAYGSPWRNTMEQGNCPASRPRPQDDLYAHYNYDFILENQDAEGGAYRLASCATELKDTVTARLRDASRKDHATEQLGLLFDQARDLESLRAWGLREVIPYTQRLLEVDSIAELNAVLTSPDFPFTPEVSLVLDSSGTCGCGISVNPNFLFSDYVTGGAAYYQDTDDEGERMLSAILLMESSAACAENLALMGVGDESEDLASELLELERSYGALADYPERHLADDYGDAAADLRRLSLAELEALAPHLPLRQTVERLGLSSSPFFLVTSPAWLEALDDLWSDDNVGTLKYLMAAKVFSELRPFVDPTLFAAEVPAADDFAFDACCHVDTMGQAVARVYCDEVLGPQARERLTTLSEDLVASLRALLDETAWLSDEARHDARDKLDAMTLNVLVPSSGYADYAELRLRPTSEGGTLVSNYLACRRYRNLWQRSMLGNPAAHDISVIDSVSPTTMNCFYDAASNSINIFPGFVTSAVYADSMSDAELLGSIGMVIGHEVSHAFDYVGSQFDAHGLPSPLFEGEDARQFCALRDRLVATYDAIEYYPDTFVSGVKVSAEATADLCGLQMASEVAAGRADIDWQAFFASCARMWAQVIPAGTSPILAADAHPLGYLRCNVNAQMLDCLYEAFGVAEGDGMYLEPTRRILIWGADSDAADPVTPEA